MRNKIITLILTVFLVLCLSGCCKGIKGILKEAKNEVYIYL